MQKAKLKDVCKIEKGKIGIAKAVEGEYPLVVTAEERSSHNEWHFDEPATIVPLVSSTGHGHASIKRLHYQEGKYSVGNILATLIPKDPKYLNTKYLYVYLTTNKEELLVSKMTGAANVSLTLSNLKNVEVEIPDYKIQLKLIKSYEQSEKFKSEILKQTEFRSANYELLHQQILQDAITGKLSKKWRKENLNVESAERLLEKIKTEKEKLIKEGKIKRSNPLPPIKGVEIPFELPEGWVWCRLGNISIQTGSGSTPRGGKEVYSDSGIPFIRSQNVYNSGLILEDVAYISEEIHEKMKYTQLQSKDILLNITGGSIGRTCIVPNNLDAGNINQHVSIIRTSKLIETQLIHMIILSSYFQEEIFKNTTGAGRQGLQKYKMDEIQIPLPPILEQIHIVERIKFLKQKLDTIKELNSENAETIKLLNQVVVQEIFKS